MQHQPLFDARSGVGISPAVPGRYECYLLRKVKPCRPWSVHTSGEGYGEFRSLSLTRNLDRHWLARFSALPSYYPYCCT